MCMAQYKDVATPLSNKGINISHWHFQRRYVTFVLAKGAQKLSAKVEM